MRKFTMIVSFEVDDQNRSFNYTLQHQGDSIYQDELADLFRKLGNTICPEPKKPVKSKMTKPAKAKKKTPTKRK